MRPAAINRGVTPAPSALRDASAGAGAIKAAPWPSKRLFAALALLTPLTLLVNGYHPFADDGAIYAAGVEYLNDPTLFRRDSVFVASHLRYSIFAHVLAAFARQGWASLAALLFACQVASIFLFLLGEAKAAESLFDTAAGRWGALLAAACCLTLPVAGTSLFLMDPYVTARSFSTPLCLFALASMLAGHHLHSALWIALAAVFHPMMAGYAAIFLVFVHLALRGKMRAMASFAAAGLLLSFALFLATRHPNPQLASSHAALSRSYFFLSTWEWYEYPGLIFPLLLLFAGVWRTRGRGPIGSLSAASFSLGAAALLSSLCFIHLNGSFLLARLQPLRAFHMIYLAGTLLLGGWLGARIARLRRWRIPAAAALYLAVLGAMFTGQRLTYPASSHVEWPWLSSPRNPWERAFLWVRGHAPGNAVFALDANYIAVPGEDAQGFRVLAERSMLADWYKDGGVASVFPEAQAQWWKEVRATEGIDNATDAQRLARLLPLGATWIIVPRRSATGFDCPYVNRAVKVCRLSPKRSPPCR